MDRKKCIETLKELRDSSAKYEQYEVKPYDVEALDYAINFIQETAQEVPVQEQFKDRNFDEYILLSDAEKISMDILKILSKSNVNFAIANEILDLCSSELRKRCFIKI